MPKAKRRLKNLTVEFISIVDSAANKRTVVYKNALGAPDTNAEAIHIPIHFRKSDNEKRLLYGIVYAPDESDTHGDTMLAEDIEKAAHAFLAAGKTNRVDKQHDNNADKGQIVESYVIGKSDARFPDDPEGAWAVVIKVTDDDTWEQVKSGELQGISMEGFAEIEDLEVQKSEILTAIQDMKNLIRKAFGADKQEEEVGAISFEELMNAVDSGEIVLKSKDFNTMIGHEKVRNAVNALERANWSLMYPDERKEGEEVDLIEQLTMNAQQFIDYLSGLENVQKSTPKKEPAMDPKKETEVEKAEATAEKSAELEAIEKLSSTVESLNERLEKVEKSAGGSQASASQEDEEQVRKNAYNPKAPLSFGFNQES